MDDKTSENKLIPSAWGPLVRQRTPGNGRWPYDLMGADVSEELGVSKSLGITQPTQLLQVENFCCACQIFLGDAHNELGV